MKRSSLARLTLVGAAILAVGLGLGPTSACAMPAEKSTGQELDVDREIGADELPGRNDPDLTMNRESAYRKTLEDYERMVEIWQEGGYDPQALLTAAVDLRGDIEALGESVAAKAPVQTTKHETKAKTSTAQPSGSAKTSSEPSTDEAIAARERATDQWLSRPIPDAETPEVPLEKMTDEQIREYSHRANKQLARLEELFQAQKIDTVAVESALADLKATLHGVSINQTPPTVED